MSAQSLSNRPKIHCHCNLEVVSLPDPLYPNENYREAAKAKGSEHEDVLVMVKSKDKRG